MEDSAERNRLLTLLPMPRETSDMPPEEERSIASLLAEGKWKKDIEALRQRYLDALPVEAREKVREISSGLSSALARYMLRPESAKPSDSCSSTERKRGVA